MWLFGAGDIHCGDLCMPHKAGCIHWRAFACHTEPLISTGGPMLAAQSRLYPLWGLCMPHTAGDIH